VMTFRRDPQSSSTCYVHTHVHVHMYTYTHACVCVHICIFFFVYVCMYVCISMCHSVEFSSSQAGTCHYRLSVGARMFFVLRAFGLDAPPLNSQSAANQRVDFRN